MRSCRCVLASLSQAFPQSSVEKDWGWSTRGTGIPLALPDTWLFPFYFIILALVEVGCRKTLQEILETVLFKIIFFVRTVQYTMLIVVTPDCTRF